jgi:pyrroline-5-carboxylate reductase
LRKISILGAGAMGSAIIKGLLESDKALPNQIVIYDTDSARLKNVVEEYGVLSVGEPELLADDGTDILLLAVKPQNMEKALVRLKGIIDDKTIVISIAAGVSTAFLLSILGENTRLVRSMPNAAATVRQSATAICGAGIASETDMAIAGDFFSSIGKVVTVDEKMMNAVTALSGSGPGYLFAIMEALSDGGVLGGLSREVARSLTVQTVMGAATMALDQKMSFSQLKDLITSPAGTTISGLKVLERSGVRGILMDTVEAARKRADELM